jgi:hypothetical protein
LKGVSTLVLAIRSPLRAQGGEHVVDVIVGVRDHDHPLNQVLARPARSVRHPSIVKNVARGQEPSASRPSTPSPGASSAMTVVARGREFGARTRKRASAAEFMRADSLIMARGRQTDAGATAGQATTIHRRRTRGLRRLTDRARGAYQGRIAGSYFSIRSSTAISGSMP